jgi:hypothetical protein
MRIAFRIPRKRPKLRVTKANGTSAYVVNPMQIMTMAMANCQYNNSAASAAASLTLEVIHAEHTMPASPATS